MKKRKKQRKNETKRIWLERQKERTKDRKKDRKKQRKTERKKERKDHIRRQDLAALNKNDMFSQNLAKLSKKRHVLILLDVLQMGGGCAPPNPPAHFFGQLLSKQIFARLSKK